VNNLALFYREVGQYSQAEPLWTRLLEEFAVKKLVLNSEVAKGLGITFPLDIVRAASQ
jgi:hypothetical protein